MRTLVFAFSYSLTSTILFDGFSTVFSYMLFWRYRPLPLSLHITVPQVVKINLDLNHNLNFFWTFTYKNMQRKNFFPFYCRYFRSLCSKWCTSAQIHVYFCCCFFEISIYCSTVWMNNLTILIFAFGLYILLHLPTLSACTCKPVQCDLPKKVPSKCTNSRIN